MLSDTLRADAIYFFDAVRFNNYFAVIAFSVLYYDYTLTFFDEIERFWKAASLTPISVLFVINRYMGLLGPAPVIVEYFAELSERVSIRPCRELQTYHQYYAIATQLVVAIMLVLRTYALYNRSKRVLAILLVTHIGGAVVCAAMFFTSAPPTSIEHPLGFENRRCDLSLTNAQGSHLATAWAAMLWFDTTIFVLTLSRALQMRRHLPGGIGGLLEVIFRDGTLYYGILVAANVSNIITFMITRSGSPMKGMDTTLTNVLSTTLTSRLILNLRDPGLQRSRAGNTEASAATVTTALFVGPLTSQMHFTNATTTDTQGDSEAALVGTAGQAREEARLTSGRGSV